MVNKTEIAKRVASAEVCSLRSAQMQVDMVFKIIKEALKENETVRIGGLGTLYPKHYKEHMGYNPYSTGKIVVPSYKTVTFKISRDFKDELNDKER